MVTASDPGEQQESGEAPLDTAVLSKGKLKRGPTIRQRRATVVPGSHEKSAFGLSGTKYNNKSKNVMETQVSNFTSNDGSQGRGGAFGNS